MRTIENSNTPETLKPKTKTKSKIYSIQYLRGIAAILIVLYHSTSLIGIEWKNSLQNARIGVDIFFIMSGFIIYFITNDRSEIKPYTFIIKRLLRVFPLFIFIWLIVSIICFGDKKFSDVIASAFLFHVDYNSNAPAYNFNLIGPAWTLTYEIYFYIIFIICGTMSYKWRGLLSSIVILLLPVLLQFYYNGNFSFSSYAHANFHLTYRYQAPLKVLSSTMMWEFVAGITLAFMFTTMRDAIKEISTKVKVTISTLLFLFFLWSVFFGAIIPQGVTGAMYQSITIIVAALLIEDILKKSVKPMEFLGDISYSIYLAHWSIIQIFMKLLPGIWGNKLGFPGLLFFILITIFTSYILNRFIEKPFILLARKIIS